VGNTEKCVLLTKRLSGVCCDRQLFIVHCCNCSQHFVPLFDTGGQSFSYLKSSFISQSLFTYFLHLPNFMIIFIWVVFFKSWFVVEKLMINALKKLFINKKKCFLFVVLVAEAYRCQCCLTQHAEIRRMVRWQYACFNG